MELFKRKRQTGTNFSGPNFHLKTVTKPAARQADSPKENTLIE